PPGLRDEVDLAVVELGDRAYVPATVHDDLLTLQRGIEVGDDANAPVAFLRQDERLGRRHVLVTGAERAGVELFRRRRGERQASGARTLRPAGRDHGDASRRGIAAKLA